MFYKLLRNRIAQLEEQNEELEERLALRNDNNCILIHENSKLEYLVMKLMKRLNKANIKNIEMHSAK